MKARWTSKVKRRKGNEDKAVARMMKMIGDENSGYWDYIIEYKETEGRVVKLLEAGVPYGNWPGSDRDWFWNL